LQERMDPRKSKLLREISPRLAEVLARRKFSIEQEVYDKESFGNILIMAVSRDFSMKITRDRGDCLIDISESERSDWQYLVCVIEAVNPTIRWNERPPTGNALALALDESYNKLQDALIEVRSRKA
jgi:hypothetical protein